jgi:hypothetical protein
LTIHAEVETANSEVSQRTLAMSSKCLTLAMQEIEAMVKGIGVDTCNFDDAANRHFVD